MTCQGASCALIVPSVAGQTATWTLGTVVNPADLGAPTVETVTITLLASVDNSAANQDTSAALTKAFASLNGSALEENDLGNAGDVVTVIEPTLTITTELPGGTTMDAGDSVTVRARLTNPAAPRGTTAHEARLVY